MPSPRSRRSSPWTPGEGRCAYVIGGSRGIGLALAERLAVAAPNTPFLFVSGYGEAAAGKIGGRPLLEKPFSPQTLLAKVREILDR